MRMRVFPHKRSPSYYIEFTDHLGIEHRLAGYRDQTRTHELAALLRRLVACCENDQRPDADLMRQVKLLSPRIRKRLLEWHLIDPQRDAEARPLAEHIDDFRAHLEAKNNDPRTVTETTDKVRWVVEGIGANRWSDLTPNKVERYLSKRREDRVVKLKTTDANGKPKEKVKRGISPQTYNHYLRAIKQFCRWMVRDGRASESPLVHLSTLNVRTDRRHDRRALSVEEVDRLLRAAHNGPERCGVSGPERALIYRLAVETGLRAGEIRSLTRASFDLDADQPAVTVGAAYAKNRREDTQPLRKETAALLKPHLANKAPAAPAFKVPAQIPHALRPDLEAAGIPYKDEAGLYADFHALRHSCGSLLAANGVPLKVVQRLMRHSSITMTADRYTHLFKGDEAQAIGKLPAFADPAAETARATGTEDADDAPKTGRNVRQNVRGTGGEPFAAIRMNANDKQRPSAASACKNSTNKAQHADSTKVGNEVHGAKNNPSSKAAAGLMHRRSEP